MLRRGMFAVALGCLTKQLDVTEQAVESRSITIVLLAPSRRGGRESKEMGEPHIRTEYRIHDVNTYKRSRVATPHQIPRCFTSAPANVSRRLDLSAVHPARACAAGVSDSSLVHSTGGKLGENWGERLDFVESMNSGVSLEPPGQLLSRSPEACMASDGTAQGDSAAFSKTR